MVWEIQRRNEDKDENQTAGQTYATGELAFRAAMGNVTTYITGHWDSAVGTNQDGPGDDHRFKLYTERRPGRGTELELRYDYIDGTQPADQQNRTNSIFWRIVEV